MVATKSPSQPALIPLDTFFSSPDRALPQISPDGKFISYLAPGSKSKALQVWVQPLGDFQRQNGGGISNAGGDPIEPPKQVTSDGNRDIEFYLWEESSASILFVQDNDGDENNHLFKADLTSGRIRDLTPFDGVTVESQFMNQKGVFTSHKHPSKVLVALNREVRTKFEVYVVDLATDEIALHERLPEDTLNVIADSDLRILACSCSLPDGENLIRVREHPDARWRDFLKGTAEDTIFPLSVVEDGKTKPFLTLRHSIGFDTWTLVRLDLETLEQTVLAQKAVDICDVKEHPRTKEAQAVLFDSGRLQWQVLSEDPATSAHLNSVIRYCKAKNADFKIVSASSSDDLWMLRLSYGNAPTQYVLYHHNPKATRPGAHDAHFEDLFYSHSSLAGVALGRKESVHYPARDGLVLQGYFTYPPRADLSGTTKYPLVLLVHGGPFGRDRFGYAAEAQWLADRGYVVLQPNYRGSVGFTKPFMARAYRQWGKTMHDDLLDSVDMAVERGFVDRAHVAIMGASYGGYAALCGVTLTPEFFTCSVDMVGPSNLCTVIENFPPQWSAKMPWLIRAIGHPVHDKKMLEAASPLFHAHKIVRPLMVAQGANDPRVKPAESERIVDAIARLGGDVYYVLFKDEGHWFTRPANRLDFYAKAELFLKHYMGPLARCQDGLSLDKNLPGSSAVVRVVGKPI